jgi:hypothetical protein
MLQAAASQAKVREATKLLDLYHQSGGEPRQWMFDMLFQMHARRGNLDAVFAAKLQMTEQHGLKLKQCAPDHGIICARSAPKKCLHVWEQNLQTLLDPIAFMQTKIKSTCASAVRSNSSPEISTG